MPKESCKCPPKGAPAWMATFGDMMSLLLTFFILIVSFSSIQEVEFQKALGSLRGALGILKNQKSALQLSTLKKIDIDFKRMAIARPKLEQFIEMIKSLRLSEHVKVEELPDAIKITIQDKIVFDVGRAQIKPEILPVLREVFELVEITRGRVRIEGHTDNVPIHTREFPSNWELSSMRAINVLHYFRNLGVPDERLTCIGYADTRPLVPNTTPLNRAKNRRVEIYIEYRRVDRVKLRQRGFNDSAYVMPPLPGRVQAERIQQPGNIQADSVALNSRRKRRIERR